MVSKRFLAAGGVAVLACVAVVTAANKWGNYHWERANNPVELTLGNNLADYWTAPNSLSGGDNGHFALAIADWNVSSVLSLREVAGNAKGNCGAKDGKIEVCSKTYGYNGWLGLAQIWISGGHITKAVAKMNDSYLGPNGFPEYQSVSWRQLVLCQEIGHDFGLAHQDEDFKNANLLSCMDYTDTPEGNEHPNQHDYDVLDGINGIYAHPDVVEDGEEKGPPPGRGKKRRSEPPPAMGQIDFETPAQWGRLVSSTANGRGQVFELDFGGGHAVLTRVLWADPDVVGR